MKKSSFKLKVNGSFEKNLEDSIIESTKKLISEKHGTKATVAEDGTISADIPISSLLSKDFLNKYVNSDKKINTLSDFLALINVESLQKLLDLSQNEIDLLIKKNTKLNSWKEFMNAAVIFQFNN